MKAYLQIIKMEFLAILEYRFNLLVGPFAIVTGVFIQCLLWNLILVTSGQDTIKGMRFRDFVCYFILAFTVHQLRSSWETNFEIIEDIRRGNITKFLIKPLSFFWNYFCVWTGRNSAFFLTYMCLLTIATIVFHDKLFPQAWLIPVFIVNIILAMLLSHCIYMILVVTNFWLSDVTSIIVGYNFFSTIFLGTLIPYSFYPENIRQIVFMTPFPFMVHIPISIAQGLLSPQEILRNFLMTFVWIAVLGSLFKLIYSRAIRSYGGYGG